MTRHHRNAFYLVGEGVYDNGSGDPELPSEWQQTRMFRFSRLGPQGSGLEDELLEKLALAMTAKEPPEADSADVPSGFTYLGQFVDHDLTKDVTDVAFGTQVSVAELRQGRSPALDLDSLYGRGPQSIPDRQFYADDARLRMGVTEATTFPAGDGGVAIDRPGFDLPRVGVDPTRPQSKADQRAPLIPDGRNDENLAVAQTHLAFIRFHNRVVDTLDVPGTDQATLFERAREIVVRHYQWMVRTDFLPRIIDPAVLDDVFEHGRKFFEPSPYSDPYGHIDHPTMPVEFSVAAYRLGHSMIRDAYQWNRVFNVDGGPGGLNGPGGAATLLLLFTFTGTNGNFAPGSDLNDVNAGTGLRLPSNWIVDFRRLYDFAEAGRPDLAPPAGGANLAKALDTRLVDPLADLPLNAFGARTNPPPMLPPNQLNLAFRNLVRAKMVRLASGQQMATRLHVKALNRNEILTGNGAGADLSGLADAEKDAVVAHTPLWFYILREAEVHGNGKLTGVGARIVAEVFHRAIEASRISILRDPGWRPSLGHESDTFRMVDLLLFAANDQADVINPLGDATVVAPAPAPAPAVPVLPTIPPAVVLTHHEPVRPGHGHLESN